MGSVEICARELIRLRERLHSLENRMSSLGKMIKDQPVLSFPQEIEDYIRIYSAFGSFCRFAGTIFPAADARKIFVLCRSIPDFICNLKTKEILSSGISESDFLYGIFHFRGTGLDAADPVYAVYHTGSSGRSRI